MAIICQLSTDLQNSSTMKNDEISNKKYRGVTQVNPEDYILKALLSN